MRRKGRSRGLLLERERSEGHSPKRGLGLKVVVGRSRGGGCLQVEQGSAPEHGWRKPDK